MESGSLSFRFVVRWFVSDDQIAERLVGGILLDSEKTLSFFFFNEIALPLPPNLREITKSPSGVYVVGNVFVVSASLGAG